MPVIYLPPLENIKQLYSISDVVILPSKKDSFPYVMLEAGINKKSFIGGNTGGIAEFIEDGVNGEEAVEMIRGFVGSVLWAIRGGNSEPVNRSETGEIKANVDRSQWSNVEVSGNLWTSSLSFEIRGR